MMSSLAFDSLRFARRLKEAGVPDSQAEAQAELMAETFGFYVDNLVTRDYLDARFAEQDATIDRRFSESEVRLEARFAQQDLYIEQRLSGLDVKLNVMAAMLAVIAASVVPIAISTLLAS
jgi:hypothetical protein